VGSAPVLRFFWEEPARNSGLTYIKPEFQARNSGLTDRKPEFLARNWFDRPQTRVPSSELWFGALFVLPGYF